MLNPPKLWLRKVDDTFVITNEEPKEMLEYLNSIHPKIKFSVEEPKDNKLPFLDCEIKRNKHGKIDIKVYKKPTHTGQYVHFTSNVDRNVKASAINALVRRAKLVSSTAEYFQEEMDYIEETFILNGYPKEFIKKESIKTLENIEKRSESGKSKDVLKDSLQKMYIPYEKGTSKQIKRIAENHSKS